jgi:outer membrane protein assembly factor BamB
MKSRLRALWILSAACGLLSCAAANAENWPRFRGPNGTGVSADKDVPIKWSAAEGVLWKTPIPGRGNSSPIVWGDRVFIQSSAADGSERWLFCLNAASGEVLWKQSAVGRAAHTHDKNTLASSTPTTDGERVYAVFWDGKDLLLNAYDFKGAQVWSRNLGGFVSEHGAGISPIIYDGKVFVADDQGDQTDKPPSMVRAFHAKDGTDAWKAERKSFRASYSTPFILKGDKGEPELIVASTAGVTGYNPDDGAEIWNYVWSFPGNPLRTVASPILAGGLVIANAGEGGAGRRSLLALRPNGKGDVTNTHLVWEDHKSFSYVPTLLASGDYLYGVNDQGFATCNFAKTGAEVWTHRLSKTGINISASPVLIDGKVYAASEEGDVYVFEATPTAFKLLAKNSLGEGVMSTPAVANNRLYIHGKDNLFCIGKAGKSAAR